MPQKYTPLLTLQQPETIDDPLPATWEAAVGNTEYISTLEAAIADSAVFSPMGTANLAADVGLLPEHANLPDVSAILRAVELWRIHGADMVERDGVGLTVPQIQDFISRVVARLLRHALIDEGPGWWSDVEHDRLAPGCWTPGRLVRAMSVRPALTPACWCNELLTAMRLVKAHGERLVNS